MPRPPVDKAARVEHAKKTAADTARRIVEQFQNPAALPKKLAALFIDNIAARHSAGYSWGNQFLVMLHGYTDAAGFNQWRDMGRTVKKGETAFRILKPYIVKAETKNARTGETETRAIPKGFGTVAVFGLEQTEVIDPELWERHRPDSAAAREFIDALPLIDVARSWGIEVSAYNGRNDGAHGWFSPTTKAIGIGVRNLSTFAHEMVHAADTRLGNLKPKPRRARNETAEAEVVAELGAAVVMSALGFERDADAGGAFDYLASWTRALAADDADDTDDAARVHRACNALLNRTCDAVALLLSESGQWAAPQRSQDDNAETETAAAA